MNIIMVLWEILIKLKISHHYTNFIARIVINLLDLRSHIRLGVLVVKI